jgi:hypothetical protein
VDLGFNADPDPAFYLNADPNPESQTYADPGPHPGQTFKSKKGKFYLKNFCTYSSHGSKCIWYLSTTVQKPL